MTNDLPYELRLERAGVQCARRPDLFRVRRDWQGRQVAVRHIVTRGGYHQRTTYGWKFGVLVPADRDDQIAVRLASGAVQPIHYRKVISVWLDPPRV